ncbi:hypothetical protein L218DRAFT_946205 [Marasmius fiardii PR-910]|nr:hypothetical protein L218DRAFT_946205 [Marasmius fiardii PR-910]
MRKWVHLRVASYSVAITPEGLLISKEKLNQVSHGAEGLYSSPTPRKADVASKGITRMKTFYLTHVKTPEILASDTHFILPEFTPMDWIKYSSWAVFGDINTNTSYANFVLQMNGSKRELYISSLKFLRVYMLLFIIPTLLHPNEGQLCFKKHAPPIFLPTAPARHLLSLRTKPTLRAFWLHRSGFVDPASNDSYMSRRRKRKTRLSFYGEEGGRKAANLNTAWTN